MLHSTTSSTSFTPLRFAADHRAVPPVQTPALLGQVPRSRVSLHEEFAAHQLLRRISELPPNWDAYGASRIQPDTALNAHCALTVLLLSAPVPEITPNTNGTVSFEWETQFGHAHFEIGVTRFSFYVKLSVGPIIPLGGDAAAVPGAIGSVISALLFPAGGAHLTATTPASK